MFYMTLDFTLFIMGVPIKCKNCGRTADSSSFVLDPLIGIVVCPSCVKDRKSQSNKEHMQKMNRDKEVEKSEGKIEEVSPAGWDAEDEYLRKAALQKQTAPNFRLLQDKRLQCLNCQYVFRYQKELNKPKECPYCSVPIRI